MEVVLVQSLTLIGLFLSMVFFTLLPLKLVRNIPSTTVDALPCKYEALISLANCLSGGVFLATFFIGLLPEVRQDMNSILNDIQIKSTLPITEVIVLFGFFMTMFTEQIALTLKDRHHNHSDDRSENDGNCVTRKSSSNLEQHLLDKDLVSNLAMDVGIITDEQLVNDSDDGMGIEGFENKPRTSLTFHHKVARPSSEDLPHGSHGHGHSHDVEALLQSSSILRFGILLLSLGVHSLFEGMALGLQTEVHTLMNLFLGVWIHECLIAFALGFSMAKLKLSTCRLCQIAFLFSCMIPVGQVIGIIIGFGETWMNRILNTILQAVAAGTFIQITFLDVIPEGIGALPNQNRMLKIAFLFLGFLGIAVITFFVQLNQQL